MTDESPAAPLYPLTVVALAASGLAVVLALTLNRFQMGTALAVGVAAVILGIIAGAAAQREKRSGVGYARTASILGVIVVVIALSRGVF